MKVAALALLLGFALAQEPAKPAVSPASAKPVPAHANSASSLKKTDPAATAPASTGSTERTSSEAMSADWSLATRLSWFTGALAAAAILQLVTLLWQASTLRKLRGSSATHAQEMEYQSRVLDGQLKVMNDQLAAVKDTASAASSSAAAAQRSIELMVSRERARLRVELQPFYLNFNAPSPARFHIQHEGSTDAFVVDSHAAVYVSDSRDPDPSVNGGKPMPLPRVIGARNPLIVAEDLLHPFTQEEIDRIRDLKSFVHFTGSIRYKDVFEGEHETRFNRVWSIANMHNLNGEPFTYWELCGTGEQNREN